MRFAVTILVWSAIGSWRARRWRSVPNRETFAAAERARNSAIPSRSGRAAGVGATIRQAFGGVVRRQLDLNDEKWNQFERVDRRFQQQRNQLQRDERETRFALEAAMQDTANVDQAKIAQSDRADAGTAPPRRSPRRGAEGAVRVSHAVAARQASGAARAAQSSRRAVAAAGTAGRTSRKASVGFSRVERAGATDYIPCLARVVELVDAGDSKSPDLRVLRVRVSPRALS